MAVGAGGAGNGFGAGVQHAVARALHDFGGEHAAIVVHGQDHDQLAVQLLALVFGEVFRALVFHFAPQRIVVNGIHRLLGGGADVAFFGASIFFVDALFNLGQQLDELQALFFLRLLGLCI